MSDLNQPTHPQAKEFVLLLNSEQRELFEERAAIYEFEGGFSRTLSELKAIEAVLKQWPDLSATRSESSKS